MLKSDPTTGSLRVNDWGDFQDIRSTYSGTNMTYKACNMRKGAATADTDWLIWKFTYDGSNNLTREQGPLIGSVDGQASLDW